MKKILFAVCLTAVSGVFADTDAAATPERARCQEILAASYYHEGVEAVCGLDNHVSDALSAHYQTLGCEALINETELAEIVGRTLNDAMQRYQTLGKDAFCSDVNRNAYPTLEELTAKDK